MRRLAVVTLLIAGVTLLSGCGSGRSDVRPLPSLQPAVDVSSVPPASEPTFSPDPTANAQPHPDAPAPTATQRTTTRPTRAPAPTRTVAPARTYYKNCAAVRAAGKAPIYRGQPGYAAHLDRDNDGVGCE